VPELDNPIFPAFAPVIERALAHHGYTPVLCTQTPGGVTEDDYVELLLERGVSGIVFVSGLHSDSAADTSRYVRLVDRGLPVVFVNGWADGIDAPFISSDEAVAVELAIGHLASLRHRRIGLAVGPERYVPTARKIAGFRRGLAETFGIGDADPWIERSLFSVEGGQAAGGALVDRGATAVVCGSDLMALGVIRAVRQRGLSVPEDVSVVGYDDSPLVAFTDPPLTTVRQAVPAMGAAAVRALLDEIGGGRAPRTELVYRPELVVRGSTGHARDGNGSAPAPVVLRMADAAPPAVSGAAPAAPSEV
ncbi:MAG: substrate-binding domain-containing protein, partial [Streptomycetaceae bacterium]|nr:substrate-binding domain-containing protein [Streptomycetaceae bacterium]